jgi:hypothetical protein
VQRRIAHTIGAVRVGARGDQAAKLNVAVGHQGGDDGRSAGDAVRRVRIGAVGEENLHVGRIVGHGRIVHHRLAARVGQRRVCTVVEQAAEPLGASVHQRPLRQRHAAPTAGIWVRAAGDEPAYARRVPLRRRAGQAGGGGIGEDLLRRRGLPTIAASADPHGYQREHHHRPHRRPHGRLNEAGRSPSWRAPVRPPKSGP